MSVATANDARVANLGLANEVRIKRARLKQEIAAGERRLQGYIAAPPWWLRSARTEKMLAAVPGLGPKTIARQVLPTARIAEGRPMSRLTLRQRMALIEILNEREGRRELDWTTADYADPDVLVEWIERMRVAPDTDHPHHETFAQAVREWRRRERVPTLLSVDYQLTRIGWHISEVPEGAWRWDEAEVAA